MIPSPRILPASSLQISLRVRHFPSSSQGAQTGPRRLAGGGAAGCAEIRAHVPLSPTLQGESPSAVNFSASSHSSQAVPRQAIFCLIPGSRKASQPLALHMRSGGICLQEVSATPPRSPAALQALLFQSVQLSVHPTKTCLTWLPTTQSTSPAKTHSQGGNSQNCCRCSRHHQQGLKRKAPGHFCFRVLTTE